MNRGRANPISSPRTSYLVDTDVFILWQHHHQVARKFFRRPPGPIYYSKQTHKELLHPFLSGRERRRIIRPLSLEFFLNGMRVCAVSLFQQGWLELQIEVLEELATVSGTKRFEFEIRADRTWQPCVHREDSDDDRHLSIAVCNIEIFA